MLWHETTLTIASGQTLSPALDLTSYGTRYVRRVLLIAPATLPESVTVLVSTDDSTYATLQSGAADIVLPAGKATQINGFQTKWLKLQAGGAAGADRTFILTIASE